MKASLPSAVFACCFASSVLAMPGAVPKDPSSAPKVNAVALIKGPGGTIEAPLFSEEHAATPIARVDGEAITVADFAEALSAMHQTVGAKDKGKKKDVKPIVDRLVATRLVVHEAMEMGLDELPEVKAALEKFERGVARDFVKHRATLKLKPDGLQVEQLYRENTREFKVRSILFEKPEHVQPFLQGLQDGEPFEALAKKAVAEKKAISAEDADFVPRKEMLPALLQGLMGVQKGKTTAPIQVPGGFAILKVLDFRQVEDKAVRREVEDSVLEGARKVALKEQGEQLVRKYVKLDQKLFDALDFEAKKPGFAALLKDQRVLATVGSRTKLTVADLAEEIRREFFHGIEAPIREKRVNSRKDTIMSRIAERAAYDAEVEALKIRETEDYQRAVSAYRIQTLFAVFVQKALLPGIDIKEKEAKAFFDKNKRDYSYPAFFRLHSLSFKDAKSAQSAAEKLRAGTDLKWLRANADGQVPEEKRQFHLDGNVLTESGLTADLAKTLKGAQTGDVRVHKAGDQHHLIWVQQITPPQPRPYEEARAEVVQKLHEKKVSEALDEWVARLRKARTVEVYITALASN